MLRVILIGLCLLTTNAAAEWSVSRGQDPVTGADVQIASVTAPSGHTLYLYRKKTDPRPVWATFVLNSDAENSISEKNFPEYQVDALEPTKLAVHAAMYEETDGRINMYEWQASKVSWKLYHGRDETVTFGDIFKFMTGKELTFRYYDSIGEEHTIVFSLDSARASINQATAIKTR